MKQITTSVLLITMAATFSGCSAISDSMISAETNVRNEILAQKAWGHWSWCYTNIDAPRHFAKGFRDGYKNVLDGGSGCQPTLPPRLYWKPHYQTPRGSRKTHAWFDGFSHGVLAANQDGYGDMGQIPISPTARENLALHSMPRPDDMFCPDDMGPVDLGLPMPVDDVDHTGETQPTQELQLVPVLEDMPVAVPGDHSYE